MLTRNQHTPCPIMKMSSNEASITFSFVSQVINQILGQLDAY
jgi:hypothetical protein